MRLLLLCPILLFATVLATTTTTTTNGNNNRIPSPKIKRESIVSSSSVGPSSTSVYYKPISKAPTVRSAPVYHGPPTSSYSSPPSYPSPPNYSAHPPTYPSPPASYGPPTHPRRPSGYGPPRRHPDVDHFDGHDSSYERRRPHHDDDYGSRHRDWMSSYRNDAKKLHEEQKRLERKRMRLEEKAMMKLIAANMTLNDLREKRNNASATTPMPMANFTLMPTITFALVRNNPAGNPGMTTNGVVSGIFQGNLNLPNNPVVAAQATNPIIVDIPGVGSTVVNAPATFGVGR